MAHGLFVVVCRLLSSCGVHGSEFAASVVAVRGLSSCGAQAHFPLGMWDLSSPTRDRTCVPCIGRRILNHWTTREVPAEALYSMTTLLTTQYDNSESGHFDKDLSLGVLLQVLALLFRGHL